MNFYLPICTWNPQLSLFRAVCKIETDWFPQFRLFHGCCNFSRWFVIKGFWWLRICQVRYKWWCVPAALFCFRCVMFFVDWDVCESKTYILTPHVHFATCLTVWPTNEFSFWITRKVLSPSQKKTMCTLQAVILLFLQMDCTRRFLCWTFWTLVAQSVGRVFFKLNSTGKQLESFPGSKLWLAWWSKHSERVV